MNISKQRKLKVITLIALFAFSVSLRAEVSIIVNPKVEENLISVDDIKSIFTNKILKWEDGKKINLIILEDYDIKDYFLKKYIHKSQSQFRTYWLKQVFTGKAIMFKTVNTEEELLSQVSTTPGAIGFIGAKKADKRVKVINVDM